MGQRDRTDAALGVEAYAYDPGLRAGDQVGLDRLRCVEDREIAALLYKLHGHVERRAQLELQQVVAARVRPIVKTEPERLRQVARDALAGKLGSDARELAEYFLRSDDGRDCANAGALEAFGRGYAKLARGHR